MIRLVVALLLSLAMATPALAVVSPSERLADPVLEGRARELSRELRCLVCQNQSIDDSDAPLAGDLRRIVREQLVAGDDEAEIKRYLVARYGDFVLLAPPVRWDTVLLWAGPFLLLLLGAGALAAILRRRSRPEAQGGAGEPLNEGETRELQTLLERKPTA